MMRQVVLVIVLIQALLLVSTSAASMFGSFSSMNAANKLRIGTRGSPLALAQARTVKGLIQDKFPELKVEIKEIMTQGDSILNQALSEIGGKGLFVKELDTALLNNDVDICVHSMKDVPTTLVPGTVLPCMLPREVTNDVFISRKYKTLAEVPDHATIGSASLRRKSQLLRMNPTWKVVNFRGNVQTRLKKLDRGEVDGTLLALAGLKRLGMNDLVQESQVVPAATMLPAVAQGAIGIQCRQDDDRSLAILKELNDPRTIAAAECERAFLASMDGNCRTPIACQAKFLKRSGAGSDSKGTWGAFDRMLVTGMIARPDGRDMVRVAVEAPLPTVEGGRYSGQGAREYPPVGGDDSDDSSVDAAMLQHATSLGRSMGEMLRRDVIGEQKFQEYHDSFITK